MVFCIQISHDILKNEIINKQQISLSCKYLVYILKMLSSYTGSVCIAVIPNFQIPHYLPVNSPGQMAGYSLLSDWRQYESCSADNHRYTTRLL